MEENKKTKARICVTGGSGFLGSWIVKRLLEDGYSVNTTTRIEERKKGLSYLTNLPGASERLQIFDAELDDPESFNEAIEGCDGVFHTAHPLDFEEKESEETKVKRLVTAMKVILQICVDSKTVRRVIHTSSIGTMALSGSEVMDENAWTDVDFVRSLKMYMGPYAVTKTLAEKAAREFADKHGLDLVSILPAWITGPFICTTFPDSVRVSLAAVLGDEKHYPYLKSTSMVHVDDVATAHIHLFEYPSAKGRYICPGITTSIEEISEYISAKYPEFQMPAADTWKDLTAPKATGFSSAKLLDIGFKYENGLEQMLDGAIKSCKEKGYL